MTEEEVRRLAPNTIVQLVPEIPNSVESALKREIFGKHVRYTGHTLDSNREFSAIVYYNHGGDLELCWHIQPEWISEVIVDDPDVYLKKQMEDNLRKIFG